MPRTYIKKKQPKYSSGLLKEAVKCVEQGMSVYAAAKRHEIPYETLRRWVNCPPSHEGSGKKTVLSQKEERYVVEALLFSAKCGFPLDRADVIEMVKSYVIAVGMKTPFKDSTPGHDFILGFEKRWSQELTRRKPELLTKARAEGLTHFVVDEFFKLYEAILKENNLEDHPERIFNLDETGLGTDPTKGKVFVPKSAKTAYLRAGGGGKLQYSVLFVGSASGQTYPPCVIYKATGGLQSTWTQGGPRGAMYGSTESGWMHDYIFEEWLTKFVKQVKHLDKPILLTFDGHGSHLTYNVTKIAQENGLILLCLPPNTSHALQPLDVGVFAPMKDAWKTILKKWYRQSRLKNIDKAVFPSLLKKLIDSSFKQEHVIGGFKGSGLYPVDKHALDGKIVTVESVEHPSASSVPNNMNDNTQQCATCSVQIEVSNPIQSQQIQKGLTGTSDPSPLKKLREAILHTISPEQPPEVKEALRLSKSKRRRVQNSIGEVLTSDEVVQRLKEEEERREEKKKPLIKKKGPVIVKKEKLSKYEDVKKEKLSKAKKLPSIELSEESEDSLEMDNPPTPINSTASGLEDLKVGTWVAVNYKSQCGKVVKQFRGQITSVESSSLYSVKFMKKCYGEGEKYIFPNEDDIEFVNYSQISNVFDVPHFNGRYYSF